MQQRILCWLIPIDAGAHPEHPIVYPPPGGSPPGIWGPPGPWPSPPIYFPPGWGSGNPPGIWGGGNVPMPSPPIANVPGAPGYRPPDSGAHPEHPIYYPPGIWGGGNVPMPSPPIAFPPWWPGHPSHPIPPGIWPQPPQGGGQPPGIWGPNPGFPSNPISGIPGLPGYEPPRPPLGTWGGGNVPMPSPPIAGVPGAPGYQPPQIPGIDIPKPSQPIIITPDGKTWVYAIFQDGSSGWVMVDEPPNTGAVQPPPVDGHHWVPAYVPGLGWCWLSLPIKEQPTPTK